MNKVIVRYIPFLLVQIGIFFTVGLVVMQDIRIVLEGTYFFTAGIVCCLVGLIIRLPR